MDLMAGNKMVGGVHLGYLFDGFYRRIFPQAMSKIIQWYNEGIVKPQIDSVHSFENVSISKKFLYNIGCEFNSCGKLLFNVRYHKIMLIFTLKYDQFGDAFRRMHERKNIGKIILTPQEVQKSE